MLKVRVKNVERIQHPLNPRKHPLPALLWLQLGKEVTDSVRVKTLSSSAKFKRTAHVPELL